MRERQENLLCDQCPMKWFSHLCAEVEGKCIWLILLTPFATQGSFKATCNIVFGSCQTLLFSLEKIARGKQVKLLVLMSSFSEESSLFR